MRSGRSARHSFASKMRAASGEAERLYVRTGWQRVGVVPDYAMWPRGGFCATVFFWKKV